MSLRNTLSRVDSDNANQVEDVFFQSPQSQNVSNPFSEGLNTNNAPAASGVPANAPGQFTFEDVIQLLRRIKELEIQKNMARHECNQLRDMLKTLNTQVELDQFMKEQNTVLTNSRISQSDGVSSPSPRASKAPRSVTICCDPVVSPLTPRASNETIPPRRQFSSVASTPTAPTTPRTPLDAFLTSSDRGSDATPRSGHKRTQTPTQNFYRDMMNGQPLFTVGMEPQEDRSLISDFFDAISAWAKQWTQNSRLFSSDEVLQLVAPGSTVCEFLSVTDTNAVPPIANERLRTELVAGIVSKDIVYNTMCDTFLFDSLPEVEAAKVKQLVIDYGKLGAGDTVKKHQLLLEQKAIYTEIKEQPKHRKWRASMAHKFAGAVVAKLGILLSDNAALTPPGEPVNRNHVLEELYIKGYRIGFRMRQAAEKWVMNWPAPGSDFNPETMVNESRYLHGNLLKTLERVHQSPAAYIVRFSKSPTITKFDFSTGQERHEVIHKGLAFLIRKSNTIGSERIFFSPSRATDSTDTDLETLGRY